MPASRASALVGLTPDTPTPDTAIPRSPEDDLCGDVVVGRALDGKWDALSVDVGLTGDPKQATFWEVKVNYTADSDDPAILGMFNKP